MNSPIGLHFRSVAIMASQDHISQFSQGIPPTQPDRSPSRTPRRDIGSTFYIAWDFGAGIPWPSSHGHRPLPSSELRLQSHLDSTEIAFDTIFNYSTLTTLAKHATHRLPDTTTISTDATYAVTSATTSSGHYDPSTLHHDLSQVTFLHASIFHVADPERLPRSAMRDPGHGQLETRRGFPWCRQSQWHRFPGNGSIQQVLAVQRHRGDGSITDSPLEISVSRT